MPAERTALSSEPGYRVIPLIPLLRRAGARVVSGVTGSSMGASFAGGEAVEVETGLAAAPRVGDVVAVASDSGLVVHRIAFLGSGKWRGYLMTKGDARGLPDEPVHLDAVVGIATRLRVDDQWVPIPSPPVLVRGAGVSRALGSLFGVHPPTARLVIRFLARCGGAARTLGRPLKRRLFGSGRRPG